MASPQAQSPAPRHVSLDTVQNCRDLGGLPIRDSRGHVTSQIRRGLLFRSSRPVFASEQDTNYLLYTLGINSIVDLRTTDEQKRDVNSFLLSHFSFSGGKRVGLRTQKLPLGTATIMFLASAFVQRRDIAQKPSLGLIGLIPAIFIYFLVLRLQQEKNGNHKGEVQKGINQDNSKPTSKLALPNPQSRKYFPVSIADNEFLRKGIVSLAPYAVQIRFLAWLLVGKKENAAHLLVKSTMNHWNLTEFYNRLLNYAQPQIARCLDIFTEESNYPIMFHCTHGKDRTGVIAALILGCMGVSQPDITDDYVLSAHHPLPRDDMGNRTPPGMDRDHFQKVFLSAHPENIQATLQFLHQQYGSVSDYLTHIGFGVEKQERLRSIPTEPAAGHSKATAGS